MADWADYVAAPFDQYLARLPQLERTTLRRVSVLRWFDQPLYEFTQDMSSSLEFEQLVNLPVVSSLNRVRPNQFVILAPLREQLAAYMWERRIDEGIKIYRQAARYFHRPLEHIDFSVVSDLIEELGYLAVVDPEQAAMRLALFGNAALLAGWPEAASRAARAVEVAPINRPGYDRLLPVARLITGLAAVLSEIGTGATPERSREREIVAAAREMYIPRNEAEQHLRLLASGTFHESLGARRRQVAAMTEGLTEREQEVLRLIGEGYSSREVAGELFISINTVKYYVSSMVRKLKLSSRNQLKEWAIERHRT